MNRWRSVALVAFSWCVAGLTSAAQPQTSPAIEVLEAIDGLPAGVMSRFQEPVGFVQANSGEYLVLDRRAHTVFVIDRLHASVRKLLQVGFEGGSLLQPGVLALSQDDVFAVSDAVNTLERIQYFTTSGTFMGGFYLKSKPRPRLVAGPIILNGVGSLTFTGTTFLLNTPEDGALISELGLDGHVIRRIGTLRKTGHESDPEVHVGLNVGVPLADPAGGYLFVFRSGVPMFRRYDADGVLVAERHIEGVELDAAIGRLPTEWRRSPGSLPVIEPLIRAAALDPTGRLWVSLGSAPVTYVYGKDGEKQRVVQFRKSGIVAPNTFFFTKDRLLVTPGCLEFRPVR